MNIKKNDLLCECETCWTVLDETLVEEWEETEKWRAENDSNKDLYIILIDHYHEDYWKEVVMTTEHFMVVREAEEEEE